MTVIHFAHRLLSLLLNTGFDAFVFPFSFAPTPYMQRFFSAGLCSLCFLHLFDFFSYEVVTLGLSYGEAVSATVGRLAVVTNWRLPTLYPCISCSLLFCCSLEG